MTNICPQNPQLNRVSWKQLESKCRTWVLTEDTLYIVCGPVYGESHSKIGNTHKVDVPIGFYKVILSLRTGHQKAIGFYYLNTSQKQSLQTTATTVDAIEHLTGIDFFTWLDDAIETQLESHYRLQDWK